MRFDGKVALITGGARGIGRATAEIMAREGARVIIADLDETQALLTANQIKEAGGEALGIRLNVAVPEEIQQVMGVIDQTYGRLDILVNNAGYCQIVPFLDITVGEWDRMLDVNLKGTFLCSQAALRRMIDRGEGGNIVNIASIAGKVGGIAVGAHYAVAKAGVICLTMSMAKLAAPYQIRVNAVAPGPIDTDLTADWTPQTKQGLNTTIPLGRFGKPEEVADAIAFLASPAARYITGEILDVNGGLLID